ncbi:hypothetical protein TNIN_232951 [Trichonephila inaurata madagascariensis]|uniref:Uncharacterized protein n=1 Tax=Trichonephila inaurata madagascariensis TaxID=2747483 RepID=A0A8X6YES6_9ARAC|nr:hypothetical protein TNIN_232951 [Trichonephila inaurata madagascariensis]
MLMWCSEIFVASPPGSKTFRVAGHLLSYGRGVQFSTKWVLVGRIVQEVPQQAFFTSRIKPAELRKSVPRRVRFPFAFGRIMNLVKTDLPSISTITSVVQASPVVY